MNDDALENAITAAKMQHMSAQTPERRRYWWDEMARLIAERSPGQVGRMERELGIYTEAKS